MSSNSIMQKNENIAWEIKLFLKLILIPIKKAQEESFPLVPVCSLFPVLPFLNGRATAMGTGDILLFLRLGLHFLWGRLLWSTLLETDATLKNTLKIVVIVHLFYKEV